MKHERWQQIDRLFQAALDLVPSEREAFLEQVCEGDPALRKEVEALLECDERAGSFIRAPAIEAAADLMATRQRSVEPGQQVGHYRVVAEIGAGGMGEVFLATDTRLGRKVALKLLLPAFTGDEVSVRRFHQEASAASALNHPSIITVYEIGHAEGLHFIATEFIEGETLRAIIQRGDAELDHLLDLITQVADGLAKAHAAGIIHRDLKPENIMATSDGYAKVLDFGLAKLVRPAAVPGGRTTETVTEVMGPTRPGVVMGTAAYMSPEQAQGKAVDQRSDIFSFGCILYEVVTGHRPFEGNSLIDILHKIVNAQPTPVTDYAPQCPAALRRIIRKCLVKNPERRYQSIKDVAVDLRDLAEGYEVEVSLSSSQPSFQGQMAGGQPPAIEAAQAKLSEPDPTVLRATRFTRASVALAILGLLGAMVIGSAYRAGDVGSELKLEYPQVAALSKAREIITSFGYEVSGLQASSSFSRTDLDPGRVAAAEGVARARRAVREGKIAAWRFIFFQPDTQSLDKIGVSSGKTLRPGEFIVRLSPRGQLVSFFTPPTEGGEITGLDREQAVSVGEAAARRMLSVEVGGYETEFITRSNRPGVAEITWQNRELVFGHREVVRVGLQGAKVTYLSRSLEPPQDAGGPESERGVLFITIEYVRLGIFMVILIAASALGVGFLIKGKRWRALRQKLALTGSVITALAMAATMVVILSEDVVPLIILIPTFILAGSVGVTALFIYAGLFEWLRTLSAWRLYGAEQFLSRRILSLPAAASLVHGVLAGALAAGIHHSLSVLMTFTPGYSPSSWIMAIPMINEGSLAASIPRTLLVAFGYTLILAVIVELVERFVRRPFLSTLIPALLLGVAAIGGNDFRVIAVGYISALLVSAVTVQVYRSRGFAAAFLVSLVNGLLSLATVASHIGDPGFGLQANLIVVGVALLLALGIWGYVREHIKKKLAVFESS